MRRLAVLVLCCTGGLAAAQAPETSLRPVARPGPVAVEAVQAKVVRPQARETVQAADAAPTGQNTKPADTDRPGQISSRAGERMTTSAARTDDGAERRGLFASLRPLLRPRAVGERGIEAQNAKARGAVCGDPAIQGEVVGRVPGKIPGCGVLNAVKVREVSGISLSEHAVMDCVTAKALKTWVNKGVKPSVGNMGGGVKGLNVAGHYVCRTRNHKTGGKISEHGKGRAIDISAILLRDGSQISVARDWRSSARGAPLRQMHKAACGPFGTVLGPNADRFHQSHIHLDTARHRGGPYCR